MNVTVGLDAPDFLAEDVWGESVRLSALRGKRVLLGFFRSAGCPVCNLQLLALRKARERLVGLTVLAVYASATENLRRYAQSLDAPRFPRFVADPACRVFGLYGVERSMSKFVSGLLLPGARAMISEGSARFRTKVEDDGPLLSIGADFLIDEAGLVRTAHRGQFSGDRLAVEDVVDFASDSSTLRLARRRP